MCRSAPKVVIKNDGTRWVAAGTHDVKEGSRRAVGEVSSTAIRAAHVPFLSRRRLESRVVHGRLIRQDGFSPDHSWQSRMLSELAREQRLDDFWRAHSVDPDDSAGPPVTMRNAPSVVHDDALVRALEPVLALLKLTGGGSHSPSRVTRERPRAAPRDPGPRSGAAVHVARRLQLGGDATREDRETAVARDEQLSGEKTDSAERASSCAPRTSGSAESASSSASTTTTSVARRTALAARSSGWRPSSRDPGSRWPPSVAPRRGGRRRPCAPPAACGVHGSRGADDGPSPRRPAS